MVPFICSTFSLLFFKKFLPTILLIMVQLVIIPIYHLLNGHTQNIEILTLSAVFLGIALGQLGLIPQYIMRWGLLVLGITILFTGFYFSQIIILATQYFVIKISFFLVLTFLVLISGQLVAEAVYFKDDFKRNYRDINILGSLGAVALYFILPYGGFNTFLYLLGILLISYCFLYRPIINKDIPKIIFHKSALQTCFLGLIAASFLSLYFYTVQLLIYPLGFTYPLFLSSALFMLAFSPYVAEKFIKKSLTPVHCLLFAIILITIIFHGLTLQNAQGLMWFDPLRVLAWLPDITFRYFFYTIGIIILLLTPYYFYSLLLPLREFQAKKNNHLFFMSLGNTLGLLLAGILLKEWTLISHLYGIFIFTVCYLFLAKKFTRPKLLMGLISGMAILLILLPKNLEQKLIVRV